MQKFIDVFKTKVPYEGYYKNHFLQVFPSSNNKVYCCRKYFTEKEFVAWLDNLE